MKKLLEKYLLFIIGLYFLATGIVLILRSTLGTTPISSINYVLSLNTSFSLGTWTFLINLLLIAGQFWFVRAIQPTHYITAIILLLAGCLVQAIGVVLEIKPRVAMMSAEGFVSYAARRYNKDFGKLKVRFDISLVTLAFLLSLLLAHKVEGIREGTVIAACITGYIVSFLSRKIMTRHMLRRILPERISI